MLGEMSALELQYWQDKYQREFLGDERADYHAALISSHVANYAGKVLKDEVTVTPLSLMPFKQANEAQPTPEDVPKQVDRAFGALMGMQAARKAQAERRKAKSRPANPATLKPTTTGSPKAPR